MMDRIFKPLGASNHCEEEREKNDYYTTDPECVRDLLKVEKFGQTILEPCCGCGNISKVLVEAGYNVISTDLIDHGYGTPGIDFFTHYKQIDYDCITNPPFGLGTEFVERCLKVMTPGHKLALFLKIQFLEGQDRYNNIYKQKHLETVYIYSKRVACYKNNEMYQKDELGNYLLDKDGNKKKVGSAACYAWYIFNTSYTGDPKIKWINTPEEEKRQEVSLFQ